MQRGTGVGFTLDPLHLHKLQLQGQLERIHRGYDAAAEQVVASKGPICIEGCGLCCQHNSVVAMGIEADYAVSYLLGKPSLIDPILDACEEWLTRKGPYTYGKAITEANRDVVLNEYFLIGRGEQCPFLLADKRCQIHYARPLVCRAYGVTRIPGDECPVAPIPGRPTDERMSWDGHHPLQVVRRNGLFEQVVLYDLVSNLRHDIENETLYGVEGFFYNLLMMRLRPARLAALMDEGKVPLAKALVGMYGNHMLLWQEQIDEEWLALNADLAAQVAPPIQYRDGKPVLVLDARKR